MLLVDDAHLLDPLSAVLVLQLASSAMATVVATVRTGEQVPDPIVALWKDGLAHRLTVEALDTDSIDAVLPDILGGPVDRGTLASIADRSQGNVLWLRELVLGALEAGTLRRDNGIWHLSGPLEPSQRLIELVESRLAQLSADERTLLELVAFGEPLGSGELAALGDAVIAERLESSGLLTAHNEGRRLQLRLAHPLYGDVLRSAIPRLRVRLITRSLAEVVEATGARRREDTLRLATWRLDGGGGSPTLMLAAAREARWHYDFDLAERLVNAAISAGADFDAELLATQIAILQGHPVEAETALAHLTNRCATDEQRCLVAVARIDNLVYYLGRISDGFRVAEAAESAITDPAWQAEATAKRIGLLLYTVGPRAAAQAVAPLLETSTDAAYVWTCMNASFAYARLGRFAEALRAVEHGEQARAALTRPLAWYPSFHVVHRCDALAHFGQLIAAEALAIEEYRNALSTGSRESQAFLAWQLGKIRAQRGLIDSAVLYSREAVVLFGQLGWIHFAHTALGQLAWSLSLGGRSDEATEALAEADALHIPDVACWTVEFRHARAWTAISAGDIARGQELLEETAAVGERTGDLVGRSMALHGIARIGQPRTVLERLGKLAETMEGDLIALRHSHVRHLAFGDAEGLHGVSAAFENLGLLLYAAEAAADEAVARRRVGEPKRAMIASQRAAQLAIRAPGSNTPSLRGLAARAVLTPAERRAATMAASGMSNKEIAHQLRISYRTVENHLVRAYAKLGIEGRGDLASALHKQ
jgi:DNA-binding CsgD family transcriptional regulator